MNGKDGYKVMSKVNGKSIFLPAAGFRLISSLYFAGSLGFYRSSTPDTSDTDYACYLYFLSSDVDGSDLDRSDGQSVRPVSD